MAAHVLVVDDDPVECRHVEEIVLRFGHFPESAPSGEAALERLARADAPPISAVILDLVMPDLDGMAVLERLSRRSFTPPVIVQAAPGAVDAGASALRAGAYDFLVKPATPERVRVSLNNALRIGALENEVLRMRLGRSGALGLRDIVMNSPSMERVHRLAEQAARSRISVLIEGERGTGKGMLARAIHGSSARRGRPFVKVDCGDAHADQIETVLFGGPSMAGKLAEASGGTLFLDEIGVLPPEAQKRIARLLADQERGASTPGRAPRGDIRLIAATNRRLIDRVSEGLFNEELFHRLNVFPIWLPPLRERRSDIASLARSFLARLATEAGRSFVTGISAEAMKQLAADPWPGNIRQLEHTIFRAVMLCEGSEITPRELPLLSAETGQLHAGVAVQEQVGIVRPSDPAPFADTRPTPRYGVAKLLDDRGEMRPFEALEEEVIRFAIDHYSGRMSEVARRLGIGRSTLYRKIKDYGIVTGEPVTP